MKKYLIIFIKTIIVLAAGYYLFSGIYNDLSKLQPASFKLAHLWGLLESFLFFVLFFSLKTVNWYSILRSSGATVTFTQAAQIWYGSQTIKYIPGKIWFVVARFYLARKQISRSLVLVTTFIEIILMLLSAALFFLLSGGKNAIQLLPLKLPPELVIVGIIPLALISIHPFFLKRYLKLFSKITRTSIDTIQIKYHQILILLVFYLVGWFLFSYGNFILLQTFSPPSSLTILEILGIFPVSYVIGFISFLTPGGIGVRESVQVYLLTDLGISSGVATAVALISRLFWMSCEVIGAVIFVGFKNLMQIQKTEKSKGHNN